jgi:hypothetical protein
MPGKFPEALKIGYREYMPPFHNSHGDIISRAFLSHYLKGESLLKSSFELRSFLWGNTGRMHPRFITYLKLYFTVWQAPRAWRECIYIDPIPRNTFVKLE